MHSLRLFCAALACSAATIPAAAFEPDTELDDSWGTFWHEYEEHEGDGSVSVAGVGDVDGDGLDDLLFGANDYADHRHAFLVLGLAEGWGSDANLEYADVRFDGEGGLDTGFTVAAAGDVNGDGLGDFLTANSWSNEGWMIWGTTHLVLGRPAGADFWDPEATLDEADASFLGEQEHPQAGSSLAPVGDFDGDGFDDFLIGAPASSNPADGETGAAYLILGKADDWALDTDLADADLVMEGIQAGSCAGHSVAGAGDVNGDGYDDILVGAPYAGSAIAYDRGAVYLFLGGPDERPQRIDLNDADASFLGTAGGNHAGRSVAGAGDLDGDGYGDFLVGSNGNDGGRVHIVFGHPDGWGMNEILGNMAVTISAPPGGDATIGLNVAGVGDVDLDGYDDFVFDAYSEAPGGVVYLVLGRASGWANADLEDALDASFLGHSGDSAGITLAGTGDANGDGAPDLLVGTLSGHAYLVRGEPICIDEDGDGYGDPAYFTCPHPEILDCDDTDPTIFPGAPEDPCDDVDSDCDGTHDEHADTDGDGFSICDGDCDEDCADCYPGAEEICDQLDNDCDDEIPDDEWDHDGDGWPICAGDCDDYHANIHPEHYEHCDGVDNDCDGVLLELESDLDGDGHLACGGLDCDDLDPDVHEDQVEVCGDDVDNDCDGYIDEYDESCPPDWGSEEDQGCTCSSPTRRDGGAPVLALMAALCMFVALRRREH